MMECICTGGSIAFSQWIYSHLVHIARSNSGTSKCHHEMLNSKKVENSQEYLEWKINTAIFITLSLILHRNENSHQREIIILGLTIKQPPTGFRKETRRQRKNGDLRRKYEFSLVMNPISNE